jgi:hypothetical protein
MGALSVADLVATENEPRVRDLDLARALGFARPDWVRKLIHRRRADLARWGALPVVEYRPVCATVSQTRPVCDTVSQTRGDAAIAAQTGPQPDFRDRVSRKSLGRISDAVSLNPTAVKRAGGRSGTAFLLNEPQALLICMFARTERAAAVRDQMIEVFMAWRRGQLAGAPGCLPGLSETQMIEAKVRLRILDRVESRVLGGAGRTAAVKMAAAQTGVCAKTIYNWRALVRGVERADWLAALTPARRGGGRRAEIDPEVWLVFRQAWLARPHIRAAYETAHRFAEARGIEIPHARTFARHLQAEAWVALGEKAV